MNSESHNAVISAINLGKAYRKLSSRQAVLSSLLWGSHSTGQHWVFRGVNFQVHAGEAVGIIGKNGAGKSTLLKILSGITSPSEGHLKLRGSVASILELGVGLHPDFTGEENARQVALLRGFAAQEVDDAIPQIRAFAEIGAYFDQPVRTYSSGMQMRLAFSIATVRQPTVLIVDEAMAVGDAYFQHKCFERIRQMRDAGAAVLLVSHDPAAIRSLCSRAMLIHKGELVRQGPVDDILTLYNALLAPDFSLVHADVAADRTGSQDVLIESVRLLQSGTHTHSLITGKPVVLEMDLACRKAAKDLTIGILIKDRLGNDVFGTNTAHHGRTLSMQPGGRCRVVWNISEFCLGPGHYHLTVAAHSGLTHQSGNYDWWNRAVTFQVLPSGGQTSIGPVSLGLSVDCFQEQG